jgi:hypothetical protein
LNVTDGRASLFGGSTQNFTLNLSALNVPAPASAGGLTQNLRSDNSGVATVPAAVTYAASATSVNVPITGVAAGSTVIHASALPNLADTTLGVTVVGGVAPSAQ